MLRRLFDRIRFRLEQWIQRGALYQLALIAAVITLIACSGGVLAFLLTDIFPSIGTAVWWSFLRLTDPGYLGDDEGLVLRIISTAVTVLGYVLFMGSLIAIMTEWWRERMEHLESGYTPIAINGHILVLGWTNRTQTIIQELVHSEERVRRFLRRRGTRNLRIVILAQQVTASLVQELRDDLGSEWDEKTIILRSGSSLHIDHLRRVDFSHAAAIVLPAGEFVEGGATAVDARVVKTLLSINDYGTSEDVTELPPLVTEIFDADKMPLAQSAYDGTADVIPTNSFLSRLIIQTVRHPGLSHIVDELLTHRLGNDVYIRSFPALTGSQFRDIRSSFSAAIPLGIVRPSGETFTPHLNPPDTYVLDENDRVALIAQQYGDTEPRRDHPSEMKPLRDEEPPRPQLPRTQRLLTLGWSHRSTALIEELASYADEEFEVDILSAVSAAERRRRLAVEADVPIDRLQIRQLEGEYTSDVVLRKIDLHSYDNIIFLGSQRAASGEASDARSILGYMLLESLLRDDVSPPGILIELMDPENADLFRQHPVEIMVSPRILSHVMAHVALRPELNVVFNEVFTSGGAEIFFRPAADYRAADRRVSFLEIEETAATCHEIALGVCLHHATAKTAGGIHLNPPKSEQWTLTEEDHIIVLATY